MCGDCILLRAKNILLVGGAIAMCFLLIALVLSIGILRRMNTTMRRVERMIAQLQSLTGLPFQFVEYLIREYLTGTSRKK